jgi:uncharacterized protein
MNVLPTLRQLVYMDDGIALAIDLYFPASLKLGNSGSNSQFPVLLEALPYRKDDFMSSNEYYVKLSLDFDFVVCRLDLRGTGSSGHFPYEEK